MQSYYNQINRFKPEVIVASANSAKALVEVANELPK
jgi:phenylacetate-coenzyme A ligase PaaK-like adenylate-forming protein